MAPALLEGERILALRLFPRGWIRPGRIVLVDLCGQLHRGAHQDGTLQIKRVVALAGESVSPAGEARQIPPGHLFVCGDNRAHSIDSRNWGPLPGHSVCGLVLLRLSSRFSAPLAQPALLRSPGLPAGEPAPPFTARTLAGQMLTLEDYRGEDLLLLFLTVSQLIRTRLPAALALAEDAAAHGTRVLLVFDCAQEMTRTFLQQWPLTQPVVCAPGTSSSLFHDYAISCVPAYCLLTAEGFVRQAGRADDSLAGWQSLGASWTRQSGEGRQVSL
jgi:hypothetical protein